MMSTRNIASFGIVFLIVGWCAYTIFPYNKNENEASRDTLHSSTAAPQIRRTSEEARVVDINHKQADTSHRQILGHLCSLSMPLSVLCIGDSITYGNGSHVRKKERDHEGNYPVALEKYLRAACVTRQRNDIVVTNLGSSGKTLLDGFKQSYKNTTLYKTAVKLAATAHVVIVMLGTNDSKPRHWRSKEAFASALVDFVEHLSTINEKLKFVLMTPPPSFPDPRVVRRLQKHTMLGNIRPVIIRNDIRVAVMSAAERTGADVIDIFGEFDTMDDLHSLAGHLEENKSGRQLDEVEAGHVATTIQQYFHDGVHPTLESHEFIASIVAHELTGV